MDRNLYELQIGDIVAHRLYPDKTGVIVEVKHIKRTGRETVYVCWFDEGPSSKKKYPQAHIVKVY